MADRRFDDHLAPPIRVMDEAAILSMMSNKTPDKSPAKNKLQTIYGMILANLSKEIDYQIGDEEETSHDEDFPEAEEDSISESVSDAEICARRRSLNDVPFTGDEDFVVEGGLFTLNQDQTDKRQRRNSKTSPSMLEEKKMDHERLLSEVDSMMQSALSHKLGSGACRRSSFADVAEKVISDQNKKKVKAVRRSFVDSSLQFTLDHQKTLQANRHSHRLDSGECRISSFADVAVKAISGERKKKVKASRRSTLASTPDVDHTNGTVQRRARHQRRASADC